MRCFWRIMENEGGVYLAGMHKASSLGVRTSDQSIEAIINNPDCCEMVFDATSAADHKRHWAVLNDLNKTVIDMTPAKLGAICVPAINMDDCLDERNINMITCGGQASLPMAYAIAQTHPDVRYIEVVSSIASRSAGPATRLNIDEYVDTTSSALQYFSGCEKTKAILIINPATPCIDMQTTIFAKVGQANIEALRVEVDTMLHIIQRYVPGYQLILPPTLENDRIAIMVKVQGLGDYLPRYAGNLDIINCAAIAFAEKFARRHIELKNPMEGSD